MIMREGQQGAHLRGMLLHLLILWAHSLKFVYCHDFDVPGQGDKKFGDRCSHTSECGFEGSVCEGTCVCKPEFPATNHLDKCGIAVKVNESCFFNEQCEKLNLQTECKEGVCTCRHQMHGILRYDGQIECVTDIQIPHTPERYIDLTMIGILVFMILMFIAICIVLRLFSKARWRENRTIFNTPNPRLMNASLFKENKHHDRRGSKTSRGLSRQPSMASLQNSQGSRRGSRRNSNTSVISTKANKSPQRQNPNSITSPMLESITVEVQEPKL